MSLERASASAPAGVGNIGVGFDIIGHTIYGPRDCAHVRRIKEPEVRIVDIRGCSVALPMEPSRNTAGAALIALRAGLHLAFGFEIELDKGIPYAAGMGGSAASAVAALVAANALLDKPLTPEQLYPYAITGEAAASHSRQGDNVGPMLLGGLALATAEHLVPLSVPHAWACTVVRPHITLETRRAREALAGSFALSEFVAQSAHLALVLTGCREGDAGLVRSGLRDVLIEPRRAPLIPGFAHVKKAAMLNRALGASISGAGPSIFAWFESHTDASAAAGPMRDGFAKVKIDSDAYVSPIAGPAAQLMQSPD